MLRIRSCLSKWTKPIRCKKVWTELADWSKTICSNKSGHLCVCTWMSVSVICLKPYLETLTDTTFLRSWIRKELSERIFLRIKFYTALTVRVDLPCNGNSKELEGDARFCFTSGSRSSNPIEGAPQSRNSIQFGSETDSRWITSSFSDPVNKAVS